MDVGLGELVEVDGNIGVRLKALRLATHERLRSHHPGAGAVHGGAVPLAVMTTSFLKISVVLVLVRNAMGIQQAPPNMALTGWR